MGPLIIFVDAGGLLGIKKVWERLGYVRNPRSLVEGGRCRPARSSADVCQRGAMCQRMGGGNTPSGVSPHAQGARLALRLVRHLHYPVGQAFVWRQPSLSADLRGRQRAAQSFWSVSTYMHNALKGHSNAKAGSASSEGSACRFTTWSRKGVVGTLGIAGVSRQCESRPTRTQGSLHRSAVLTDRNFISTESSGSKGPLWSPARTIERSQEGTRGPKQKSNQWTHLSPFYTRMHGEWLRYAKSTSQFNWHFLFSQRWSGLPSKSPYVITT